MTPEEIGYAVEQLLLSPALRRVYHTDYDEKTTTWYDADGPL